MAKRFTDTGKWDHAWFRKLSPAMKVVWFYLLDKCDHAGVWIADFEALSFCVGEDISQAEFEVSFVEKVQRVDSDKYLVPAFVDFQYGQLNPENRVHKSVLSRLEKIAPKKVLKSPLKGAKDKDKDKDKDNKGGVGENEFLPEIEKIYLTQYPRHKGKDRGLRTLSRQITTQEKLEAFARAVRNYAADCKNEETPKKFIKHFSTFANEWEEWARLPEVVGTESSVNAWVRQEVEKRRKEREARGA